MRLITSLTNYLPCDILDGIHLLHALPQVVYCNPVKLHQYLFIHLGKVVLTGKLADVFKLFVSTSMH